MIIKLKSLKVQNFKGIEKLDINFSDRTIIKGENEAGKTRVADAFIWVLHGKDTEDRKDHEIKTYDEDNNIIHGLEHSVEMILSVTDVTERDITFKRVYKEKWTKKTGEAEKLLTGHTTDFYIDTVGVKKKEYDDYVNKIITETNFKLLTCNNYFNVNIDWKKRREIIMDMFSDSLPSDMDIINSDEKLKVLELYLSNKTIENAIKEIKSKKKLFNDEIKQIPVRIDELNKTEISGEKVDIEYIQKQILEIKTENEKLDNELCKMSNISSAIDKQFEAISKKKKQINIIVSELENSKENQIRALKTDYASENNKLHELANELDKLNRDKKVSETELIRLENTKKDIYVKYDAEVSQTFKNEEEFCITCFQKLPADHVKTIKEEFEANKKTRISDIKGQGLENNQKMAGIKGLIDNIEKNIKDNNEKYETRLNIVQTYKGKLQTVSEDIINTETEEVKKLRSEILELEKTLDKPDELQETRKNEILKVKKTNNESMDSLNSILIINSSETNNTNRINELMTRERELAQQIANLEQQEFASDNFIKKKVNLIESKVSQKFGGIRFKLFNTLINGGLEECCETIINGVPFSVLSNGCQIKCGLKIIEVLQKHFDFKAPVFVDNAEGVTSELKIDTQLILLFADTQYKNLYIES